MIKKLDKVDEWCGVLGLKKPSPKEIMDFFMEPFEIEESRICEVFGEFVKMCEARYAKSTYMPDYDRLGLNCTIPESAREFNQRVILGVTDP